MDIFKKYWSSLSEQQEVVGADIIDRLVDRFHSSTRLEDKRDALRCLKSLSKKYRLEVGTRAMDIFRSVLMSDWDDPDCTLYSLEALFLIMNDGENEQLHPNELVNIPSDLGSQFSEIFLSKPENYGLVLSCLDAPESFIRRNAMRLLNVLSVNRPKDAQDAILLCGVGISKLVDILSESNEVLRNDVILLLIELTKSHRNIQNIVAFENALEHLVRIAHSESLCDGGVVVEDCLRLLCQLLEGNLSNQVMFREGNFIRLLSPLFDIISVSQLKPSWSTQQVINFQLLLQLIRSLVSPNNKIQDTKLCQNMIRDCGLLEKLCCTVMGSETHCALLAKVIFTLSDVIRGCPENQEYLSLLTAPSDPPQPAITVLLVSMINERQSFLVRVAILYCFQCYLMSNPSAQSSVITTLLPYEAQVDSITTGQLLCGGLFSNDTSIWFTSIGLLHCINDNSQLKEQLLRVHLSDKVDAEPTTLFRHCLTCIQKSCHFQTQISLLQLLCTWLAYCPPAVHHFLTVTNFNPKAKQSVGIDTVTTNFARHGFNFFALVSEIATVDNDEWETLVRGLATLLICICLLFNPDDVQNLDRTTLLNTLKKRIGIEVILERLSQLTKAEPFVHASKKAEPIAQTSNDLIFDHAFTVLFKKLEHEVIYKLRPDDCANSVANETSSEEYEEKLANLRNELLVLRNRNTFLESELKRMNSARNLTVNTVKSVELDGPGHSEITDLENRLALSEQRNKELEGKLRIIGDKYNTLSTEHDDLLMLLYDQSNRLKTLGELVKDLGGEVPKEFVHDHLCNASDKESYKPATFLSFDPSNHNNAPSNTDFVNLDSHL